MAEDWNAPKWTNGAKEDKERERTSLRVEGSDGGGWRRAERERKGVRREGHGNRTGQ